MGYQWNLGRSGKVLMRKTIIIQDLLTANFFQVEIAPVIGNTGTPSNPVYQTGDPVIAWKRRSPPEDSEKFYNFTLLAAQLNEPEDGVAPTDSRLRPDQR